MFLRLSNNTVIEVKEHAVGFSPGLEVDESVCFSKLVMLVLLVKLIVSLLAGKKKKIL